MVTWPRIRRLDERPAVSIPTCGAARRRAFRLGVAVVGLLAAPVARAQVQLIEPPPLPPALVTPTLLSLDGRGCAVRFFPGSLDRAHHLLRRLEVVTFELNRWSDVPVPTAVYLVNREEWGQAQLPGVYGIPIRAGPTAVIAPAQGDPDTVRLWLDLLGVAELPMVFGTPIQGTAQEAATLALADVLLQVETARGFVQRAGLLGSEVWIGEVAAHVAALVIFRVHEPTRLAEIGAVFDRLAAGSGVARAPAVGSFRPDLVQGGGEQIRSWLGFQARFHQGARIVFERDGKEAVKKLQKLSQRAGGVLRADDLRSRYPDLGEWLAANLAP